MGLQKYTRADNTKQFIIYEMNINIIILFLCVHVQKLKLLPVLLRTHVKTPLQGAQTTIYCAVSEEMEGVTGKYLADCKITKTEHPQATDDELAEKLWEISAKLTEAN